MALHAKGKQLIQDAVDSHKEFKSTTTRAEQYSCWEDVPKGRLDYTPRHYGQPVFVIFSYETPIAWRFNNDYNWTQPEVNYSKTTTNHQGVVAVAIDNKGFYA